MGCIKAIMAALLCTLCCVIVQAATDPCPGGTMSTAIKMTSCLAATKDANVDVSAACCFQVTSMVSKPDCLCSCVTSSLAKGLGVNPTVAVTIPKRCNIASRPVGYKCGGLLVP